MLRLLKLKLRDLLAFRWLVLSSIILPLLLGMIAGIANLANREMGIRLAIVDYDNTSASAELIGRLRHSSWDISPAGLQEAQRLLYSRHIDGIVIIEEGYARSLNSLDKSRITFNQAEGSLVTTIVRETIASAVLPAHARNVLLEKTIDRYDYLAIRPPADLEQKFISRIEYYAAHDARLIIEYVGQGNIAPLLTYVVSDYSLEVLFLSIYAVIGVLLLADTGMRQRLATTKNGLLLNYCTSMAALFLLGVVQIVVFSGFMTIFMRTLLRLSDILYLIVFLLLMIGLGQLLQLVNARLRLFLALLLIVVLAVAGGSFFHLPETLLRLIGQYTPHGWVLSKIGGYSALPFPWPLGLALLLLAAGYLLQKRSVVQYAMSDY